ncbi:MAG TPA: TIGR03087 family PEP-CTERM/XrtA system glycosyltransferase [Vicinamibacteria bacterium]
MAQDLLYLVHRIPYPPNKGDKIRSFHLLRFLAERYRVHLGTFVDYEEDWKYLSEVGSLCADVCAVKLNPTRQGVRSLKGLLAGEPLSVPYYASSSLRDWVRRKVEELGITRMVFFSSPMVQYAPSNGVAMRKVVDFVDVDSEKWRQYSERRSWPLRWLYRREGELLLDFERAAASSADASIFVTREEAEVFRLRARPWIEDEGRIRAIPNGVDTDYFAPQGSYPSPFESGGPVMVFTGMMDYWANVDAVTWFAEEACPRIRTAVEGARFFIVGARPTRAVEKLGALPGVTVTGQVEDVRPYLAHAEIAVAPLRVARGIQNKVLEAMAMAKPVVATAAALEGLELPRGLARVGSTSDELAAGAIELLRSRGEREALGARGRGWVEENHDWARTLLPIAELIENGGDRASA